MKKTLSNLEIENVNRTIGQMEEKQRRQFLFRKVQELGRGGLSYIASVFHVSCATLIKARKEIESGDEWIKDAPNRAKGGGRKKASEKIDGLRDAILKIVDPTTYGVPTSVLKWTTMSLRKIVAVLREDYGINVCHSVVQRVLKESGYSRQKNKKAEQVGTPSPNRDEQFRHIDHKANDFLEEGEPVISVDTKKKENIGNFANNGTEYRKKNSPRRVWDHDFPVSKLGKVAPYGIYCMNDNTGYVNLGTDHDTSEFAMTSIFLWWEKIGRHTFPKAKKILITCDCGGSNRSRGQMWKEQLLVFSALTGLEVHVAHFPAGCSKWNKIEHRLFAYVSKNWQGKPLIDIETCVKLIGSTTTTTGLKVVCQVDHNKYELNKKLFSKKEFEKLPIDSENALGYWNYVIDATKLDKDLREQVMRIANKYLSR